MMRGSTDSDDDVPSTISSSSLMYLMNFQTLKPCINAIDPRTMNTNEMLVIYTQAISFASGISVFSPYLPTVKAMAPNAPTGAACMISPITPNIR